MICPECGRDVPVTRFDEGGMDYFRAHGDLRKAPVASLSGRKYQPTCAASGRLVLKQTHPPQEIKRGISTPGGKNVQ